MLYKAVLKFSGPVIRSEERAITLLRRRPHAQIAVHNSNTASISDPAALFLGFASVSANYGWTEGEFVRGFPPRSYEVNRQQSGGIINILTDRTPGMHRSPATRAL